jgi:hypothetical protein
MAVELKQRNGTWKLYVGVTLLLTTIGGGSRAETTQQWRRPTGALYFGNRPPAHREHPQ